MRDVVCFFCGSCLQIFFCFSDLTVDYLLMCAPVQITWLRRFTNTSVELRKTARNVK